MLLFYLLALIAEILGTIGGFGSSLFFVPIANYYFDFQSALGITAVLHLTSNISKIALFKDGLDKKLLLTMGIPGVIFVIIGAYLSKFIQSDILEVVLGIFLVLLGLLLFIFQDYKVPPTKYNAVIGGIASGFFAGLLGTGGAIRGITLAGFGIPMGVFIATSACIDFAIDASRSVVYFFNGFIHKHDIKVMIVLPFISIAGTYIGKYLLTKISEKQFRYIVLILIILTGLSLLAKWAIGL